MSPTGAAFRNDDSQYNGTLHHAPPRDCGRPSSSPLPDNCTEDGGVVTPATRNTVEHAGLLSEPELRLISEWLDIGGQYYNNPFDPRLAE